MFGCSWLRAYLLLFQYTLTSLHWLVRINQFFAVEVVGKAPVFRLFLPSLLVLFLTFPLFMLAGVFTMLSPTLLLFALIATTSH